MNPAPHWLTQATEETTESASTETTTEVNIVCGNQGALCEALFEWSGNETVAEVTSYLIGVPLKIILIVAGALVLNRVLRRLIRRSMDRLASATTEHGESVVTERSVQRAEERASTISSLLRSLSTATVYSVAVLLILEVIGISLVPVIASAGVLSLAVGFGAQSVVEDLLRGVFMLAEDQFGVGDRIDVGRVNGTVERVTLRTTVIRDAEGTLWHVPNSEIAAVANENQETSRATVDIGISYAADIGEAMEVLEQAAEAAAADPAWQDRVTEAPQVRGVQSLGDDAVNLRVIVWVTAGDRRQFERHLLRTAKEALDTAGIELPNRQVDVWLRGQPQAA